MIFADKLIMLRKKSGWSQEELAEQMEVSRQSVSKWEGAQSIPDLDKMVRLSKLFGVSTDYLLKDELESEDGVAVEVDERMRRVSMEEAHAFLSARESASLMIARATFLCIVSPVCLMILAAVSQMRGTHVSEEMAAGIGMVIMLVMAAIAVAQFITVGNRSAGYDYLEKENFETEYGVQGMVKERQEASREAHNRANVAGVSICILSLLPLFLGMAAKAEDLLMVILLCLMLVLAGVGVYVLIRSGVVWASYEKLLQEGEYTRAEKRSKSTVEAVSTAYWLVAVAVYLVVSLPGDSWDQSWIVWPIAGVLYAAMRVVISGLTHRQSGK